MGCLVSSKILFVIMFGAINISIVINSNLFSMEESVTYITSIPYQIKKSGEYILSSNVIDEGSRKEHFDAAIKIYKNADVTLDLQGITLNAGGRHFAIDANFARSLYLSNGTITGATIGVGGLYSYVVLDDVTITGCKIPTELKDYEIKP